jgi:hypothetical protein
MKTIIITPTRYASTRYTVLIAQLRDFDALRKGSNSAIVDEITHDY